MSEKKYCFFSLCTWPDFPQSWQHAQELRLKEVTRDLNLSIYGMFIAFRWPHCICKGAGKRDASGPTQLSTALQLHLSPFLTGVAKTLISSLYSQETGLRALCWPSLENTYSVLWAQLAWRSFLQTHPYFHLLWCHSSFSLRSEGSCGSQFKVLQSHLISALWHLCQQQHHLLTFLMRQAGTCRSLLCHVRAWNALRN